MEKSKKNKILKGSVLVLILSIVIGGFVFAGKQIYQKGLADCEKVIQEVPEQVYIEQEERWHLLSLIHTHIMDENYPTAIYTFRDLLTKCSLLDVEIDELTDTYIFFGYRRREIVSDPRLLNYENQEHIFERAIRELYERAPIFLTTVDENERIHYRIYFKYKFLWGDQPINQIEQICVNILSICENGGNKVQLRGSEYILRDDTPEPIIFYDLSITTAPYTGSYFPEDAYQEIRVLFHELLWHAIGGGSFSVHYSSNGDIDDIAFDGRFDIYLCLQYMDFR